MRISVGAAVAAVVTAGVLIAAGRPSLRPGGLLTRGQLDKAAPGCKWWFCAQPAGDRRAAAVSAATHPGYTVEEVDNLPHAEQMTLAPQMGQYLGAYTSKLPAARPPRLLPARPTSAELEQQAREFVPAEVAAQAAARNLGVRVAPFRAPLSSTEEYYDWALQSLHAIPRGMGGTLQSSAQRVQVRYHPRGPGPSVRVVPAPQASRDYESSAEGGSYGPGARGQRLQRPMRAHASRVPTRGRTKKLAVVPARQQQLLASRAGGASVLSAIKAGGQAYVDKLEAQLAEASATEAKAKMVMKVLHNPGAQLIPAGYAGSDQEALRLSQQRAVVWHSPTEQIDARFPQRFEGVGPPRRPPTLQGVPYRVDGDAAQGYGSTIYGQFVNYGPMKRWAAEDTAEHAYTLSKWREALLSAKIEQAKLSQQLMESAAGLPVTPVTSKTGQEGRSRDQEGAAIEAAEAKGEAEGEARGREEERKEDASMIRNAAATARAEGGAGPKLAGEVKSLKSTLYDVAHETAVALGDLRQQVARGQDVRVEANEAGSDVRGGVRAQTLAAAKQRVLTRHSSNLS